jgi:hypothetical protein
VASDRWLLGISKPSSCDETEVQYASDFVTEADKGALSSTGCRTGVGVFMSEYAICSIPYQTAYTIVWISFADIIWISSPVYLPPFHRTRPARRTAGHRPEVADAPCSRNQHRTAGHQFAVNFSLRLGFEIAGSRMDRVLVPEAPIGLIKKDSIISSD